MLHAKMSSATLFARLTLSSVDIVEPFPSLDIFPYKYGYLVSLTVSNNYVFLLLDNALVDPTDLEYYVVKIPKSVELSRLLIIARNKDEPGHTEGLQELLEKLRAEGTFYKWQDLFTLLTE